MYASAQKDRKEGNPIKGPTDDAICTILSSGFDNFESAQRSEKKWFESERSKSLTTDLSETDVEDASSPEKSPESYKINNKKESEFLQKSLKELLGDIHPDHTKKQTTNYNKKVSEILEKNFEDDFSQETINSKKSDASEKTVSHAKGPGSSLQDFGGFEEILFDEQNDNLPNPRQHGNSHCYVFNRMLSLPKGLGNVRRNKENAD
ncbi:hypothetical protein ACFFRR_009186 [Megaselia abdita]